MIFSGISFVADISKATWFDIPGKTAFARRELSNHPLNPTLALISQKNKGLQNEKTGQTIFEESLSGELPMTGLEPALYY